MALAILGFRDDTADSIMLPPYVVGRCGDRGSGHSSNINNIYIYIRIILFSSFFLGGGANCKGPTKKTRLFHSGERLTVWKKAKHSKNEILVKNKEIHKLFVWLTL